MLLKSLWFLLTQSWEHTHTCKCAHRNTQYTHEHSKSHQSQWWICWRNKWWFMPNLMKGKGPNYSPTVVNHNYKQPSHVRYWTWDKAYSKMFYVILFKILVFCLDCACSRMISCLMIMASHQTFSGQIKHMSGQIKFALARQILHTLSMENSLSLQKKMNNFQSLL